MLKKLVLDLETQKEFAEVGGRGKNHLLKVSVCCVYDYSQDKYFTFEEHELLIFFLILGGFIGARLYHVFSSFGYYLHQPGQILAFRSGGLSIFGALFGGLLVLFRYSRKYKAQSFPRLLDWLAPSLLVGQIIGRFGNLFNYEAFGYPTSLPWKMFVPLSFRPVEFMTAAFFHPLFLYEALFNAAVLVFLWRVEQSPKRAGILFLYYIFLYNIGRFFLELLRTDSMFIGIFRLNSITSLCLVAISLMFLHALVFSSRFNQRRP